MMVSVTSPAQPSPAQPSPAQPSPAQPSIISNTTSNTSEQQAASQASTETIQESPPEVDAELSAATEERTGAAALAEQNRSSLIGSDTTDGRSATDPAEQAAALAQVQDPRGVVATLDPATRDAFATAEAVGNTAEDFQSGGMAGIPSDGYQPGDVTSSYTYTDVNSGLSNRVEYVVSGDGGQTYIMRNNLSDGRIVEASYVSARGAFDNPGTNHNDLVSVRLVTPAS